MQRFDHSRLPLPPRSSRSPRRALLPLALSSLAMPLCGLAQEEGGGAEGDVRRPVEAIYVWGRGTEMLGSADSGSHGIVGNADFSTRPLMRVGELVEVVPGMIATQHSGPGKANQYFLRGMNLDHGSDFSASFEGMPVNFRSHAHASGYLELNFIIPEIVETVEFHKGTYYARNGDFSAAGSARFKTYDRLERNYVESTVGNFGHERVVGAASFDAANGSTLYALELQRRDGPWQLEENVKTVNGFAKYTGDLLGLDSQLAFSAYDSSWNATDQIPLREVDAGRLDRFGFVDPDLGGQSSRYSAIGNFTLGTDTDLNLYASRYRMNLFSNPTYFLNDPENGDEIEQEDSRTVYGGSLQYGRDLEWGMRSVSPLLGLDLRFDDIGKVNLFNTAGRERIGVVRQDAVEEFSLSLFGEAQILWTDTFRTTLGLRNEFYDWDVEDHKGLNSGSGSDSILLPKFTAAWIPTGGYELYFNYGQGFHSNDVRGAETLRDPVSGEPVDPVDVLVRAEGAELGLRAEPVDGINLSLVYFWMDLESELLFVGDAGTSEPNDPTRRRGIEATAFWEINDYLVMDANATWNRARFKGAPAGLDRVPDAHETTASAGLTYVNPTGFTASLRMRHFGSAPLEESNTRQKEGTTLWNLGLSYPVSERLELGLDVLNLFDSGGNDIEYWFESRLAGEAAPVEDFHFHPVESRAWRLQAKYLF